MDQPASGSYGGGASGLRPGRVDRPAPPPTPLPAPRLVPALAGRARSSSATARIPARPLARLWRGADGAGRRFRMSVPLAGRTRPTGPGPPRPGGFAGCPCPCPCPCLSVTGHGLPGPACFPVVRRRRSRGPSPTGWGRPAPCHPGREVRSSSAIGRVPARPRVAWAGEGDSGCPGQTGTGFGRRVPAPVAAGRGRPAPGRAAFGGSWMRSVTRGGSPPRAEVHGVTRSPQPGAAERHLWWRGGSGDDDRPPGTSLRQGRIRALPLIR